jgi:endo-1,4-beta-xylanase
VRRLSTVTALSATLVSAAVLYPAAHNAAQAASGSCSTKPYPDVPRSSVFCADIGWLKSRDITRGYQDGRFHPKASIIRQEMAAYLFRLSNPGADDPTCTSAPYPDVSTSSTFCGDISWLKQQHITEGYQDGGFHPTASIARQEMAAFLHRLSASLPI